MNIIDKDTWSRRDIYEHYSKVSDPFYMVSFRQDVTGLYNFVKDNGLSFYYAMTWAVTMAVNEVDAFLMKKVGDDIVRIDGREPSLTDLRPGSDNFYIVTCEMCDDIREFCRQTKSRSEQQTCFLDMSKETDELIYISCLPWIDLTGLTNERDYAAPGALDDNIPRITWGRYTETDGRRILGISIEVNHRFVDGVHIGRFAKALTKCIEDLS